MSSVLHVSSGAIAPVVAPSLSRFCSSASTAAAAAASSSLRASPCFPGPATSSATAFSRATGLRQLKFAFSTSSGLVSNGRNAASGFSSAPGFSSSSAPRRVVVVNMPRSWLSKLGLGNSRAAQTDASNSAALGADDETPAAGHQFATFGAGCFWGVELGFQRVAGVSKTEVGYTQGLIDDPTYGDVCEGDTQHSEVVRVEFDPAQCPYEKLLQVFWGQHDPTTLNRQGGDRGTQYRSGIYFYSPEQEKAAKESAEKEQKKLSNKIVTEILPAKKFYRAEEYHQQYLSKGGRYGFRQSAAKGCSDPIRCYG